MRGKVAGYVTKKMYERITPAYAGKSLPAADFRPILRDHPRVCGEKTDGHIPQCAYLGSPPRMRGKANWRRMFAGEQGITPAYAGKSDVPVFVRGHVWDHPRVCGEKSFHSLDESALPGSPPRVRGKASFFGIFCPGVRITPACAGKSLTQSLLLYFTQDHPRVCGEK